VANWRAVKEGDHNQHERHPHAGTPSAPVYFCVVEHALTCGFVLRLVSFQQADLAAVCAPTMKETLALDKDMGADAQSKSSSPLSAAGSPQRVLNSGVRVFFTGFSASQKNMLLGLLARIPVLGPDQTDAVAAQVATSPLEATHVVSSGQHTVATLAAALRGQYLLFGSKWLAYSATRGGFHNLQCCDHAQRKVRAQCTHSLCSSVALGPHHATSIPHFGCLLTLFVLSVARSLLPRPFDSFAMRGVHCKASVLR